MSTGNRGRFSDRIKKIAFFKRNRNNKIKEKRNFKRFLLLPIMFIDKFIHQDKSNTRQIKSDSSKNVFVNASPTAEGTLDIEENDLFYPIASGRLPA